MLDAKCVTFRRDAHEDTGWGCICTYMVPPCLFYPSGSCSIKPTMMTPNIPDLAPPIQRRGSNYFFKGFVRLWALPLVLATGRVIDCGSGEQGTGPLSNRLWSQLTTPCPFFAKSSPSHPGTPCLAVLSKELLETERTKAEGAMP
jgi:hypothetical protein